MKQIFRTPEHNAGHSPAILIEKDIEKDDAAREQVHPARSGPAVSHPKRIGPFIVFNFAAKVAGAINFFSCPVLDGIRALFAIR